MPRRKKKVKEAVESQNLEKKDVETPSSVSARKKRRLEDAFIVISDSDGEESREENGLQKTKTKQSNRAKCLTKRKIAQMTEEEQFALALKMSEQEAREVNSQEEEEEELLRKAIAESLNSCQPSDASAARPQPLPTGRPSQPHQEKTTDSGTTKGTWQLVPPSLFKGSHVSQGNEAEQREAPWDHTENAEEEPGSGSSASWDRSSQPVLENENVKRLGRCTGHLAEHTQCGKPQESTGLVEESPEEGSSGPASQSIAALTSKSSSVLMPESSAEEIIVCPETQPSTSETLDLKSEVSPGSRETMKEKRRIMADKKVGDKEDAEKEIPISAFSSSTEVSCPLCDQGFPPTKIELHAMYCDGLMGQDTVLTRRQKEARSKSNSGTAAQTSPDLDRNEKCYLCKSLVPFREYQRHVDSCLQLAKDDRGDGPCPNVGRKRPQRLRHPKEKGHSEGRLLSLLEQSEHKSKETETKTSETGACRAPSPGLEEAGCSSEKRSSHIHPDLSESPIKPFVSISEATDCLVDFEKQVTVRQGSRTRTKAGRGRRRKF
ncbi:BRCA1-A complex subunit RAP80 isoform X4 [Carlito syrichta]|uniref:BRCA1-A complex subunit RAP80 n=1 Tax=Carlito syrichta TaxID=1868482 RepID=A0A3Q0E4F6_CARSF|nr:BRCA1-A complex subunit RAP80 isoform X4 [Carlito syrichta]